MQQLRGYRFAGFSFDLAKRRLSGPDGAVIPLAGRAHDVLAYLVEHRDRVVGKDELIKAVWPNSIVEDNNLNQAISTVRRAIGDSRETPTFIVTVAGRGYQFIGDVIPLAESAAEPREAEARQASDTVPHESSNASVSGVELPVTDPSPSSWQETRVSRRVVLSGLAVAAATTVGAGLWWNRSRQRSRLPKSIAVLPFKPLLPEARNPAMELGVTELLINRLSRLPGVVVAPLSSVMRFAATDVDPLEAGRKLGVEAVVDGRLHVHEDRVRLTARLLAVDDGASLWANNFTEPLGELLAVQDTLADAAGERAHGGTFERDALGGACAGHNRCRRPGSFTRTAGISSSAATRRACGARSGSSRPRCAAIRASPWRAPAFRTRTR